jgi:Calx-beta domain
LPTPRSQPAASAGSTRLTSPLAWPRSRARTDAAAGEGGTATLTASRQGLPTGSATVEYATSPGTAGSGQDFEPVSGTLSWANGESTSKPIAVAIKDDADPEGAETFTVTLSNPSAGTTIAPPATATVTIDPSDQPLGDLSKPVLSTSAKTPRGCARS